MTQSIMYPYRQGVDDWIRRLLHTYVSAHDGTFDDPEKSTLRTFLDARQESELGLGADELRKIRNVLV